MKNWAISIGATMMAVTPLVGMTTSVEAATTSSVETVHGWVDYHSQPKLKSSITGRLLLGQEARLVKKANAYWYEINVNGKIAYITTNTKYTKLVSTTSPSSVSTQPSSGQTSSTQYLMTNKGWVDYHSGPSTRSAITGRMHLGDKAELVRKYNAYWYEIRVNGNIAYITTSSKFVHLTDAANAPSAPGVSASSSGSTSTSAAWKTQADAVISAAKTQLGVPYLWGKQLPGQGFDCSNFSEWAFHKALGLNFTTSSVRQRNSVGTPVALSNIREGDLLFFKTAHNATGGGHVGIYMGNGQVIQEGGGWGKVTIESLAKTWLGRNLVFARRVIQ